MKISDCEKKLGNWQGSLEMLDVTIPILKEFKSSEELADCHLKKGRLLLNMKGWDNAVFEFNQAVSLFEQIDNKVGKAIAIQDLGNAFERASKLEKALELYTLSSVTFREEGMKNSLGISYNNQSRVLFFQREFELSIPKANEAINILEGTKNVEGLGIAHNNLGKAYREIGEIEKAIISLNRAKSIYESLNDSYNLGIILNDLGLLFIDIGQYDKAKTLLEQSINISVNLGYKAGIAAATMNMGKLLLYSKNYKSAEKVLLEAKVMFIDLDESYGIARCNAYIKQVRSMLY